MARSYPSGRIGLHQLLAEAELSKNTFFRRYRNDPEVAVLLDIQEDRDHRLHFRADAGTRLKQAHGKAPHGNRGHSPSRACPGCDRTLHPRHRACEHCGYVFPSDGASAVPKRSTAESNYRRREQLRVLKEGHTD